MKILLACVAGWLALAAGLWAFGYVQATAAVLILGPVIALLALLG